MDDGVQMESAAAGPAASGGVWKRFMVAGSVIAAVVVALVTLPLQQWLLDVLEWVDGLGAVGPLVVIGVYVIACVLFIPGSLLTVGAGLLFGPFLGTITVSIASILGASAAFLVGRTVAREAIERKVAGNEKFAAIDEAVGKQGFKIVMLTRLSPIFPFNLLNYAYGLTKVPFKSYFFASWIGMLPGTIMYVYFGSVAKSLTELSAEGADTGSAGQIAFWIGLVVAVAVGVIVTRVARKALAEAIPEKKSQQ